MSTAKPTRPALARIVAALPATVPFVPPEAIERRTGHPLTLRLGANESMFGPAPRARAAMLAAVERIALYADPEGYELRAALAAKLGIAIENVGIGSGIDDFLGLVVRAFLDPGEVAVTTLGGYPTFNYHVAGFGGVLERVPYRDDRNDLDGLSAAAHRTGAKLVYLVNPDNPSGSWHSGEAVQAFLESLPDGCLLLLDEAYHEFAPPGTVPPLDAGDPRVVRVRTFSKVYGMAGARIGYALAAPETIAAFDTIRHHYGVNLVAQAGALASLAEDDFVASVVAKVARGREEYATLARELGLTPLPSATNFVTIDVGGVDRAKALVAALAERGVFIRMPGAPPLDRCIRVTVGTAEQRAAFAPILRAALAEMKE
jgi:histidinol-phosphate aminotransferase